MKSKTLIKCFAGFTPLCPFFVAEFPSGKISPAEKLLAPPGGAGHNPALANKGFCLCFYSMF